MARARQTVTVTTKQRKRKVGGNTGMMKCNICHGTGVVPNRKKKK